jgi:proline dehydrogenase
MNWRRVAEKMGLRNAVRLMDEREVHEREIEKAELELGKLAEATHEQAAAVAEMKRQTRLGSYSRVRIHR